MRTYFSRVLLFAALSVTTQSFGQDIGPGPVTGPISRSSGSSQLLQGTLLTSTGSGLLVSGTASVTAQPGASTTISTSGTYGYGVVTSGSAQVSGGSNLSITTSGNAASAVYSTENSSIVLDGVSIVTLGAPDVVGFQVFGAYGLSATDNSSIAMTGGSLTTSGSFATGVRVDSGASVLLTDVPITTSGDNASGLSAISGGHAELDGGSVTTMSAQSNGVDAQNGTVVARGVLISTNGQFSSGAKAYSGGSVTLEDSSVSINGQFGSGLAAQDAGSVAQGTNLQVYVSGGSSIGVAASSNSQVTATSSTIEVSGASGAGAQASSGGIVTLDSSNVEVSGTNSHGLRVFGIGTVVSNNTSVDVSGAGGAAIQVQANANVVGRVNVNGGSLRSAAGPAILVGANASPIISLNDVATITGNGTWLTTTADAGDATINASRSHMTGVATTIGTASTHVSLLDNSLWTMTGDSNLTELVNTNSRVDFTPPDSGTFKNLTVGSYVGASGVISLNAELGDDGSPSDRLTIDGGTASGNSSLLVANAGGAGALTAGDGILVVDAINGAATAPGAFALGGPVAAGPYEYLLYRGGLQGANPENWYLRSFLDCQLSPSNPLCTSTSNPPSYRRETSLFSAMSTLGVIYGGAVLDSLDERVGALRALNDANPIGNSLSWTRLMGQQGSRSDDGRGIYGSFGPSFDYGIRGIQTGFDILRRADDNGGFDQAGPYFAYGNASANVQHFDGTNAGSLGIDAFSLGGYWTHFGKEGWYVDTVLQGTLIDGRANGRFQTLHSTGLAFGASIEAGYPFVLQEGVVIEPQAQAKLQLGGLGDGSDGVANVHFGTYESLTGRLGVKVSKTWVLEEQNDRREAVIWGRASVTNEFLGPVTTELSSADGPVGFSTSLGGPALELNAGIDGEIAEGTSLYGSLGYALRLDGRGSELGGRVGFKVKF